MGEKGEGSGGEGGGKWGERGRELGMGYPPVHPLRSVSTCYYPFDTNRLFHLARYFKLGMVYCVTVLRCHVLQFANLFLKNRFVH